MRKYFFMLYNILLPNAQPDRAYFIIAINPRNSVTSAYYFRHPNPTFPHLGNTYLRNGPFCVVIRPISHCKMGRFGVRNGPFRNALYISTLQHTAKACRPTCPKHASRVPQPTCKHSHTAASILMYGRAVIFIHEVMCNIIFFV